MGEVPHDLAVLLAAYHRAEEAQARADLGYPTECPSTRGYRPQGWRGEALDVEAEAGRVNAVRAVIERMPRAERIAAGILARNAATGRAVWRSAALPADDEARGALMARVIDALCIALGIGMREAA